MSDRSTETHGRITNKLKTPYPADKSDFIETRQKILINLYAAGGGHYGGALSVIDILFVLYKNIMNFEPIDLLNINRDRLILSKGHAAIALYVVLAHFKIIDEDSLKYYGQFNARLEGHPDMNQTQGVDFSTGSLGQGLSVGVGMAFKLRDFNRHVWVILGDGECQEGQIWEAAMLAARYCLDNIHVIIDANGAQEFGFKHNEKLAQEPIPNMIGKWQSFGWAVQSVDGHSHHDLREACIKALETKNKPSIIIAKTRKGSGVPMFEENPEHYHCITLTDQEHYKALMELSCNNN